MKVRRNSSVNKVRQAVLAGIFTLTGSAGAMAAVPAAPMNVSVSDTGEVTVSMEEWPAAPEWVVVPKDHGDLAPIGSDVILQPQLTGFNVMPTLLDSSLMTELGKAALGGAVSGGITFAFNAIYTSFKSVTGWLEDGVEPDPTAGAGPATA